MKRCIYGVDLNPMAVELAKLSLWLHSFTVGAPLSFLDHHLKAGNSLIGTSVGTVVDEIQSDLFGNVRDEILRGTKFLQDAAFNTDATLVDVEQSAEAFRAYQDKMRPYKRLLDLWTAQHFGHDMGRTLVRDYAREVIEAYKSGEGAVLMEHGDTVEATEHLAEKKRVFHWELEFPEVFYELDPPGNRENPGFDAVIGNPPYALLQGTDLQEPARKMYPEIFSGSNDISNFFLKKGGELIKREGEFSFIVTRYWTEAHFTADLRSYLTEELSPVEFVDFGNIQVWPNVNVLAIICRFRKSESERVRVQVADEEKYQRADRYLERISDGSESPVCVEGTILSRSPWYLRSIENAEIWQKVRGVSVDLDSISRNTQGIKTGNNDMFVVSDDEVEAKNLERERLLPMVEAREVRRFSLQSNQYVIYLDGEEDIDSFPGIHSYLQQFRSELEERAEVDRGSYPWWRLQRPREREIILGGSRILVPLYARENRFAFAEDEVVGMTDIYVTKIENDNYSEGYVTAVLDSTLLNSYHANFSKMKRAGYLEYSGEALAQLPIREIDFTTPEDEREAHLETLTDAIEATRPTAAPGDNPVFDIVEDHLSTEPERADVIHDLLAHLAREMTQLKDERHSYYLDVTDYVDAPEDSGGVTLREIGRYQPAPGVQDTLLAETTDERDGLRVGHLAAESETDGDALTVTVHATARFKPEGEPENWPDAVPTGAEPDQWGYVETTPIPVCTLHDCTDIEAGLVVHWSKALNDTGDGFSGYRDNATKTNSLLDRIYDARFPDPSDDSVQSALQPFLDNAAAAAELDAKIEFTDHLIDHIVYRLYGLSDEEIEVVEQ
ncbi:Eco57I restriction-modification methylase domain-containing protein [Salinibacter sp.]|uniref:Eco57I restriction-modification methylase domain-containing protein n=1 Tax=Salinibacter sp. TaxID=2065818 RepID=UPI003D748804